MPLFGKSKEQKIADAMETLTAKILDLHAPSTTIIQFLDNNVSTDNDTGVISPAQQLLEGRSRKYFSCF